jgi:sugar lactone lactonase YvrE
MVPPDTPSSISVQALRFVWGGVVPGLPTVSGKIHPDQVRSSEYQPRGSATQMLHRAKGHRGAEGFECTKIGESRVVIGIKGVSLFSRFSKSLGSAFVFASFAAAQPQFLVSTIAGGSVPPTPVAALSTAVTQPQRVAVDGSGNVYFTASNAVFKMSGSGTLTLVAGTGRIGYSGDGGPAAKAQFNNPQGVAVDFRGNIFVADTGNSLIRIITPDGNINLYAGSTPYGQPASGWSGDGGPAIGAALQLPVGMAVDGAGDLFIADSANNAIREVTTDGNIKTIAGLGPLAPGFSGDGASAVAANLNGPLDVAVDAKNNVFIADTNNANVREITNDGNINTIAGSTAIVSGAVTIAFGYSGDGGPATKAELAGPAGVAVDSAGNLYIATYADNRIRKVDTKNIISTFAGNSGYGFAGDGGPATSAQLSAPRGICTDSGGNIYLADRWNNRIRKIAGGTLTTIAGNGQSNFGGDFGPATNAQMSGPAGVAVDNAGNIYISDFLNNRVRMVTPAGVISTYAGNGVAGFSGDGGPATSAALSQPAGLVVDSAGNLYIADSNNSAVRKVTPGGVISTVAGTGGVQGFSGDGGQATSAKMMAPFGLALNSSGNLYISDYYGWIRLVNASTGVISTIAGNGTIGYSGDGGAATAAQFYNPAGVALDLSGNVYVADSNNGAVREISNGTINTIAGNGTLSYSGDGALAFFAQFSQISGIAVDAQSNVYVADSGNNVIRLFPVGGIVTTIAGNGTQGYTGDGGVSTIAEMNGPRALAVTAAGNVYFTDTGNNAARLLTRQ